MADSHDDDPNVPPIHYDVRESFVPVSYFVATVLGVAAVALGIVLGVVLAND